ncbi:MAG TPA: fatty acid desaturase family protein [Candidatus Acidoferrales bacterium]|nr:fatty acid desaturase family protein [Candidatus Acidoferrales bacterium]
MNHRFAVPASADERRLGDDAAGIPVKLDQDELRRLSRVNPILGWMHVIGEWSLIVATIYLCQRFWNPVLYIFAVAFIGARQHALLILMHDGVHYRLFRNRPLNDWVSEVLLAWPHLVSARAYRKNHFAHHKYLNSPQDPDWKRREGDPAWIFPQPAPTLAKMLFRDVSGLNALVLLRLAASLVSADKASTAFLVARYGFYVAALSTIVYVGAFKGLVIYWLVPLFTWLVFIMRIRSIAEHHAIEPADAAYPSIRTTRTGLLERVFLAPKNVNYHIEHHFFPSVPFYRLPKLHALLMSQPEFREGAHVTDSYWGVLVESVARPARPAKRARGFGVAEMQPVRTAM